ncbi:MAG TPA: LAGLIDADG family homing endonuclease [Nitrososphaerales archaeon]|nr:LAGLIDADG family homing endonuclease [Nitrososphaerales archaeon]
MATFDYDVIVAGGGMSGLITAAAIGAYSKQKARVLVVDRNLPESPGKKTINGWTCGDAVSKRSLDYIADNIGIRYGKPELEHRVEGVLVYSPDHETKVLFEGEGYILNRKILPRRQVEDAKKLGVEFVFNVVVDRPLSENGAITGVIGRNMADGTEFKKTARLVVDAAGSATKLRPNLPIQSKIEKEINRDDLESTGRYIFDFKKGADDPTWFDSKYAIIHLDQYLAPGGYCLAPDTPVVCKNSLKPIQDIKIGDEILTSSGWIPVADTSVREYNGELVSVTPSMLNFEIKMTPDHLVRVWNQKEGETWKPADLLVKSTHATRRHGDYLVLLLPKQNQDQISFINALDYVEGISEGDYVHVGISKHFFNGRAPDGSYQSKTGRAKHPKGTKLPVKVPLSNEFLELCGWYVSEGCIKRGHVTISNTNEKHVERIKNLIDSLGYNWLVWDGQRADRTLPCHNIEITNSLVGTLFGKCFGIGAHTKKLPPWVYNLSEEGKLSLLRGMYLGDGTIEKGRNGRSDKRNYTTVSRSLIIDLWMLLASLKVVASIKLNKKKGAWVAIVSGYQANFFKEENLWRAKNNQRNRFFIGDGCIYVRIRKLARIPYSGPVYDLNSAGDFSPIFNVHNCWTFAKGEAKVNIGLGVQKKALDARNAKYNRKDGLQDLIDEYVRQNKAIKNPLQSPGEADSGNTKGSWQVSVRRHNDCLVANGYAIVGDAGWMARPIDAGGIGPSIYASVILGRVAAQAIEVGDTSEASLWRYNIDYMRHHGYQMASFEVLRRYLQTLSNDEISYGMKYFLSEEDVAAIVNREHPKFSRLRMLGPAMLARIATHPGLAKGLQFTAKKSETLIEHNLKYPDSPSGFDEWRNGLHRELNEAFEKF